MENKEITLFDIFKANKKKKEQEQHEVIKKKTKAALLQKPQHFREDGFKNRMAIRNYSHVKK